PSNLPTPRNPAPLIAALTLATTPLFWSQTTIAEVYTPALAALALILLLLLRWRDRLSRGARGQGLEVRGNAVYLSPISDGARTDLPSRLTRSPGKGVSSQVSSGVHGNRDLNGIGVRGQAPGREATPPLPQGERGPGGEGNQPCERRPGRELLLAACLTALALGLHLTTLAVLPAAALFVWLTLRPPSLDSRLSTLDSRLSTLDSRLSPSSPSPPASSSSPTSRSAPPPAPLPTGAIPKRSIASSRTSPPPITARTSRSFPSRSFPAAPPICSTSCSATSLSLAFF
ncbi:MAG: DUF2723 domain-containing protein, partial [Chloroflexi bacterium]|nr:DUF2723 domain-containing protein [Chloroflexota bacterium]